MDFVPLIDRVGEEMTATLGGGVIGFILGFALLKTGFCTRMAVIDMARARSLTGPATWLLGFAAALLAVQALLYFGVIAVDTSRFFATGQSLSGALFGGAIFGIGMVLTRGCVSRLLVLGAAGNLRAIYSLVFVALAAYATLYGFLVPGRDAIAPLLSTAAIGGNALVDHTGGGNVSGVVLGAVVAVVAIALAARAKLDLGQSIGAVVVGLMVAAAWYFTATLTAQLFEPIAIDSISFIRPLAQTSGALIGSVALPTFDFGLVIGTFAGGLLAALVLGRFKVATFSEPGAPRILRYTIGAAMMGFGGVLAAGCSIGAGLTGGSVLAASALIALLSMAVAGAVTDTVLDRPRERNPA